MNTKNILISLSLALALAGGAVADDDAKRGFAKVEWKATSYTDIQSDDGDQAAFEKTTKDTINAKFNALARKGLTPGQTLNVTVLDIDLAGEIKNPNDFRRVSRKTPPQMVISYVLTDAAGQTVASQDNVVVNSDSFYQGGQFNEGYSPLPYDTAAIGNWFSTAF